MKVEEVDVTNIRPYDKNPRKNDEAVSAVAESISKFGFRQPIVVDADGVIICGHTRYKAALSLGMKRVPVHRADGLTPEQVRALRLADNRSAEIATWDTDLLSSELADLLGGGSFGDDELEALGFGPSELDAARGIIKEPLGEIKETKLADRFIVPPFTIFPCYMGYWQERKRRWLNLGIESEIGRNKNLVYSDSSQSPSAYKSKARYENKIGRRVTWEEFYREHPNERRLLGTSVFDPVLCEIMYHWFCPPGGLVFDPFAGGSVRGIVASYMDRDYVGIELRKIQVEANIRQGKELCADRKMPRWIEGDSRNARKLVGDLQADFVFTCPPYADLERYSDDPRDLSTMEYGDFMKAYRKIIRESASILRDDRFACIVVGEIRDKSGVYRGFIQDTIRAFGDAGMSLYNEAILITVPSSLASRARKVFTGKRKLGKTHQNVLVFVKGDIDRAVSSLGEADLTLLDEAYKEGLPCGYDEGYIVADDPSEVANSVDGAEGSGPGEGD